MLHQDKHLVDFIAVNEGLRLKPYQDSEGVWTIGYGYNMEANGIPAWLARQIIEGRPITREQGAKLLIDEIANCISQARRIIPNFADIDRARQFVIVDMCYNLGATGFSRFTSTIAAIIAGRYGQAAKHMSDSLWYRQVGDRAKRNVRIMRSGKL